MANASGDEAVRRLELRVGYPHEAPDSDFLSLNIVIDGQEPFTWAGSKGPYIGPWPPALLTDESPLIPADPPRRIMLYFEGVPDPDESMITAIISVADRHVVWSDFRECTADSAQDRDSDGILFDLYPAGSKALSVPDLVFDRDQYLAEVQRASTEREWESDRY